MEKLHDDLREVMGLLGKAAPGEWAVDRDRQVYTLEAYVCNANIRHTEYDNDATAQAIAAAVNFLRQHGPALLARQEGGMVLSGTNWTDSRRASTWGILSMRASGRPLNFSERSTG